MVLLVNDGLLPASDAPSSVAVVGPLADRVLPDWYSGTPVHTTSVAQAVAQRWPQAQVHVVDGADHVALRLPDGRYLGADDTSAVRPARGLGSAARLALTDWGWGLLTVEDLGAGLLWTTDARGRVLARAERPSGWVVHETFRMHRHDDGTASLRHVASGRWLRLDAADRLVAAAADVAEAARLDVVLLRSGTAAAAAAASGSDLVVCALGSDPHLLGRETEDRPALEVPPGQQSLWDAVHDAAPDAVLAFVSSYPYAFEPDARAVLWSSHSQPVGHGLIDVLAGDVEPSGRLPQTWWRRTADAGDLRDYDIIAGRCTYWYSAAAPLFPFGHGLTYSQIEYRSLDVAVDPDGGVTARVEVHNEGARRASEVVQVYTDAHEHRKPFPHRLGGFARLMLEPGETTTATVTVPPDRFEFWDTARGSFTTDPGRYRISAGPNAADAALRADIQLEGSPPVPHRLPIRASAYDRGDVRLVAETPERGTALAGPGWFELDDVEDLAGPLAVRVRRSAPGPARVELRLPDGTTASAEVPDDAATWVEVGLGHVGSAGRGGVRMTLTGSVAVAQLSRPDRRTSPPGTDEPGRTS